MGKGSFGIIYRVVVGDLADWSVYLSAYDEPAVFTSFSDAQLKAEELRQNYRCSTKIFSWEV